MLDSSSNLAVLAKSVIEAELIIGFDTAVVQSEMSLSTSACEESSKSLLGEEESGGVGICSCTVGIGLKSMRDTSKVRESFAISAFNKFLLFSVSEGDEVDIEKIISELLVEPVCGRQVSVDKTVEALSQLSSS